MLASCTCCLQCSCACCLIVLYLLKECAAQARMGASSLHLVCRYACLQGERASLGDEQEEGHASERGLLSQDSAVNGAIFTTSQAHRPTQGSAFSSMYSSQVGVAAAGGAAISHMQLLMGNSGAGSPALGQSSSRLRAPSHVSRSNTSAGFKVLRPEDGEGSGHLRAQEAITQLGGPAQEEGLQEGQGQEGGEDGAGAGDGEAEGSLLLSTTSLGQGCGCSPLRPPAAGGAGSSSSTGSKRRRKGFFAALKHSLSKLGRAGTTGSSKVGVSRPPAPGLATTSSHPTSQATSAAQAAAIGQGSHASMQHEGQGSPGCSSGANAVADLAGRPSSRRSHLGRVLSTSDVMPRDMEGGRPFAPHSPLRPQSFGMVRGVLGTAG